MSGTTQIIERSPECLTLARQALHCSADSPAQSLDRTGVAKTVYEELRVSVQGSKALTRCCSGCSLTGERQRVRPRPVCGILSVCAPDGRADWYSDRFDAGGGFMLASHLGLFLARLLSFRSVLRQNLGGTFPSQTQGHRKHNH